MTFDALLLASFGGPEGPDEVVPFLERVTAGRGIPPERLVEVGQHYFALGGVSPINGQNRALIAALGDELSRREVDLPVYFGNRNSQPFLADALRRLHDDGHRRVLAVATSAYSSYSGCRQYREDLASALEQSALTDRLEVVKLRPYGDLEGFSGSMAAGLVPILRDRLAELGSFEHVHLFFTTHSIPDTMARTSGGDPYAPDGAYVAQHRAVVDAILAEVAAQLGDVPAWSLVYQSRSGPPGMPWLEPDINDAIREAASTGATCVVLLPIGFTSDHIEVVWDLDTQARQTARDLGLDFHRAPTAGIDPSFVSGLVDLVLAVRDGGGVDHARPWQGLCGETCCPNPRASRPVVPAPRQI
jgi:protoporphyrin/coproporphyrin ferrochelatase